MGLLPPVSFKDTLQPPQHAYTSPAGFVALYWDPHLSRGTSDSMGWGLFLFPYTAFCRAKVDTKQNRTMNNKKHFTKDKEENITFL